LELAEGVVLAGRERNKTVATAESCSGGLIASALTSISGSSEVFKGGVVVYSNCMKEKLLGVSKETLESRGAVSADTALEMAAGLQKLTGADINISVTGIAGPTGGTPEKPVGLVYLGVAAGGKSPFAVRRVFGGDREQVRYETVRAALVLFQEEINRAPAIFSPAMLPRS
jgi:PncC family amidohydrolase